MKHIAVTRSAPSIALLILVAKITGAQTGPAPSVSSDSSSKASLDTAVTVSYGGFVDTYYAYDFGRPKNIDRAFTTQAARHNEFNVNLAYVEAKVSGPRVRGRLALQAGTSVQSNYSGEPRIGTLSGPDLSRFIQEAVAGYAITPSLWIDGGIFVPYNIDHFNRLRFEIQAVHDDLLSDSYFVAMLQWTTLIGSHAHPLDW